MADDEATTAAQPATGESPLSVGTEDDPFTERPEVYVGAAFAGGFVLAKLLGKLGGGK